MLESYACCAWFIGSVELTVALHVFYHQLSPPLPSSLAPIKPADPDSPGKNSH